ncbi:MAG TPA: PLP-dependent aminotransferase family protein [Capillimicrobium sp.]|jgi:DNA-binding transcriptional MocR family regulator
MSDATRLVAELGPWRAGAGRRYEQLAAAIREVVERGSFDGATLPAERRLAAALGVSRSTVTRAYAELRRDGSIASRERSGTVVRAIARRRAAPVAQLPQVSRLLGAPGDGIDLSVAAPPLDDLVRALTVTLGAGADGLHPHGYLPAGLPALRAAVAERETRLGVPTAPEEVLITCGAHEALHLLTALLVGRRQAVVTEAPTYAGALEIFERAGARAIAVPDDVAGMRPDGLREALSRTVAGLVYLMPGCRNPTGQAVPDGRRRALLAIAEEHDVPVLEDATLDEVRFAGPRTPLRALSPQRVIRIGSISKIVWGGLRVGWVCAPREIVGPLARLKAASDLGGGLLGQVAALELLRRADELFPQRRRLAQERIELLAAELRRAVPAWRLAVPEGGWSLWAQTPGADGDAVVAAAAAAGVHIAPGRSHLPDGRRTDWVRVCAGAPPERLALAAERLAIAWEALRDGAVPPPVPAERPSGVA